MAQTIKLKRSSVAGNIPSSSDLALGEIAVNTADGALYIKKGDNTIVAVGDNDILHIDTSNGRVGVGTTSPSADLTVSGTIANDAFTIPNSIGSSGQVLKAPTSGTTLTWADESGSSGAIAPSINTMTGDGSTTTLALSTTPVNENATIITFDGVLQHKSTYSLSGSTITFSTAPANGVAVECIVINTHSIQALEDGDSDTKIQVEETADEDKIRFDTAGTERMIIDASGNVGIGTSSPTQKLQVNGNIKLETTGSEYVFAAATASNSVDAGHRYHSTEEYVATFTGATERMRIDSSGNVGIGTDSPSDYYADNLVVNAQNEGGITLIGTSAHENYLMWADGTSGTDRYSGYLSYNHSSNFMRFATNGGTERMRIDSSGNLLVGKTSANNTTQGIRMLGSAGFASFVRASAEPIVVNRLTDDGDLIEFRKDGTTVGSIGASGGSAYIGGYQNAGLYFNGTSDVRPWNTSTQANLDNSVDLGNSSARFKDLHLSGTANADKVLVSKDGTDHIEVVDASSGQVTNLTTGNTVGYISVDPSNSVAGSKFGVYVDGSEYLEVSSTGIDVTGNITVSGTVDGRDIATDGTKLDGIEANATADQTQSEINALGITATGLSGTPNITVGTISSGAITATSLQLGSDTQPTLSGDTNVLRIQTSSGYIDLGPNNTSYAHIQTDLSKFYFNKKIIVNEGIISSYDEDLVLQRASSTVATFTTTGATFAGTLEATSFSDGTISGITFIDEDSFATNSATRVPTQQSIKAYVDTQVAGVVDSAPAALDTLNELAAALGDDANFSTTTSTALGNRLRVDTAAQGLTGTQQANAITNLGITATKAELNYVDGVTSDIQTQLDAKLASSSYTAADVLTKIKTVDGSGSGLDADTLDGISSASFLRSDAADTMSGALTINTTGRALLITGNSTLDGSDASIYLGNAPSSYGFDITYEGTGSGNTNAFVITATNLGTPKELIRANQDGIVKLVQSGATIAGNTIWHAGNDGASSGLDADLLDGQHGSYYLDNSNHTNNAGYTTNTGTVSSLSDLSITSTAAELNKLDGYTGSVTELNYLDTLHATGVTSTEFDYLDGVTSNIQTQLDGKQATGSYLTGNQTITLSGDVSGSGTTSIAVTVADDSHNHVISNVDGLQTALDGKAPSSTTTTANAALPKAGGTMTGNLNISKDNPVLILNETSSTSNADQIAYISFQDNGTEEAWVGWGSNGNSDFTITNNIGSVVLNGNGTTQINDNLDLNGNADISGNITVTGDGFFNGTKLEGDSKEMIRYSDAWLRLNPANEFTSGIYCGTGLLRTDGTFQVGASGSKFAVNGANGNVTLAGTVDGRDIAADGSKLDGIETGATADQTQSDINALGITQVGTISSGTWQGTAIASAYLDSDTAHLSGTQTFTGAKTFSAGINLNNSNISGVGAIQINDPGPNEGVTWSNIKIYESPDDLTTNTAGNFQVVYGSTRRFTVNNTGADVNGALTATTKSFDIEHPSKEGMRLHHGVVEGPEHSVYVRGKSKEKVILLPDYWVDLVHEDTITVQLTAIGGGQNLYVEDIKDNKVYVNGENYFYYIQAERKDVERFEVEYEV